VWEEKQPRPPIHDDESCRIITRRQKGVLTIDGALEASGGS
jgi:hypothetical protein